jgi:hypothetical protein
MDNVSTGQVGLQERVSWQRTLLIALFLILFALALWMIISQVSATQLQRRQAASLIAFEEETGIRVLRVAVTAGGGMLDFQYQVIDPDKALIVHDDETPPALISEATNQLIATPFHDHSFRELHTAVTYHEVIMNGGGLLERGDRITLTLGDSKLEGLIVE